MDRFLDRLLNAHQMLPAHQSHIQEITLAQRLRGQHLFLTLLLELEFASFEQIPNSKPMQTSLVPVYCY